MSQEQSPRTPEALSSDPDRTLPVNLDSRRFALYHIVHGLGRLKTVSPDKPLVVGSYAYLDGELHVRLSLAMDAIVKGLTESRSHVMVGCEDRQRVLFVVVVVVNPGFDSGVSRCAPLDPPS